MEVSLVKIGNSRGIKLSRSILEKYDIKDKVELFLEKGKIILRPVSKPREGWEDAFKRMHQAGDDELLIEDVFEDEDFEEWS